MIPKIPTVLKLIKMLDQHASFLSTSVNPLCFKIYISVFHYDLSKPRVTSQSLYCFMIEGGEFSRSGRLQYYRSTKSLSGKKRYNLHRLN